MLFRPRTLAGAIATLALLAPATAAAHPPKPLAKKTFVTHAAGEARLALTASAPGTDWGTAGRGRIVTEQYQAPNHETKAFSGAKEGLHPLLVNVTANNNLEQVTDPAASTGYRFFLSATATLPAARAREAVMDANPWTYQVTAKEIAREGELEPVASPDTPAVSDQRNYLFAEVDKDTSYPAPPANGTWVGTALAVQLRGGDRWYTSHHDTPDWSIQRDDPAATTVELPPGTTEADVAAVKAIAVPVARTGDTPAPAPSDYTIHVRALNRGFLLDDAFLPQPSFLQWTGDEVLTPQTPEAVLWAAP